MEDTNVQKMMDAAVDSIEKYKGKGSDVISELMRVLQVGKVEDLVPKVYNILHQYKDGY